MQDEKSLEYQRAMNRQKHPEVAAIVDELARLGLGHAKVKYIGPLRDETRRALKLEGRAKLG